MSQKPLDTLGGVGGAAVKIADDPGKARNIHITVLNPTAATHAAFFGRSQREVSAAPTFGFPGFAIVAAANSVATQTINNVAYTSFILQAWTGELWAIADIGNGIISIDVFDSAYPEN